MAGSRWSRAGLASVVWWSRSPDAACSLRGLRSPRTAPAPEGSRSGYSAGQPGVSSDRSWGQSSQTCSLHSYSRRSFFFQYNPNLWFNHRQQASWTTRCPRCGARGALGWRAARRSGVKSSDGGLSFFIYFHFYFTFLLSCVSSLFILFYSTMIITFLIILISLFCFLVLFFSLHNALILFLGCVYLLVLILIVWFRFWVLLFVWIFSRCFCFIWFCFCFVYLCVCFLVSVFLCFILFLSFLWGFACLYFPLIYFLFYFSYNSISTLLFWCSVFFPISCFFLFL